MTTTGMVRSAGSHCGNDYAQTLRILRSWSDPFLLTSLPKWQRAEYAKLAKAAIRLLQSKSARHGGTAFYIDERTGHIGSVDGAAT